MTDLRIAQTDAEVLADLPVPSLRVAQTDAEVLADLPVPSLRVAQTDAEVLADLPVPSLRVATLYVEVLVPQVGTVSAFASIPTPSVSTPTKIIVQAAKVSASASIPTPSVSTPTKIIVQAAKVSASASIPAPPTVGAGASVTATVVAGVATVGAPTVGAGSATVNAVVAAAVTTVGVPVVSADAVTINAATVNAVTTTPAPTVSDASVTINAVTVNAVTTTPAPTVSDASVTINAVTVTATSTAASPTVYGPNLGPPASTTYQTYASSFYETGSGDVFYVTAPRSTFTLTYVPMSYSEHVTVSIDGSTAVRKLRRTNEWSRSGREVLLVDDAEQVFTGNGPWLFEVQYAYGGSSSAEIPEGEPPPDDVIIDDPPPTVPPPPGAILYGSSPNGASGGSKQSIVQYVDSIFGGLDVLRAFDDFPASWSDTRTAKYTPPGAAVVVSIKPGMANVASRQAGTVNQIKNFLRSIPANIPAVYVCMHHEPENDTGNIPAGDANTGRIFRQAWAVFLQLVDEVRGEGLCQNVYTMTILMSFSIQHRNPEDWYVAGADVLGWDTYNTTNLTALRNYSIAKGKPWAVCEIGAKPVANYTDQQYANELENMFNVWTGGATDPILVCYFQSTVGDNYVITPETRPISVAWWRSLCETGAPP